MSYNFSFTAPTKQEAKDELCRRNTADGGCMPEPLKHAAQAMIDAMGEPPLHHVFNVATYGHSTPAGATVPGPENITLSIAHVYA